VQKTADGAFVLSARVAELKHNHRWLVGSFYAHYASWEHVGPFEVDATMTVANHPSVITSKLIFKVHKIAAVTT
jgi:hypothetical protein